MKMKAGLMQDLRANELICIENDRDDSSRRDDQKAAASSGKKDHWKLQQSVAVIGRVPCRTHF